MSAPRIYYNERDPYAAQWLRNLIMFDCIAPGDVDERSIEDVKPEDLRGYTQCHFFAGIGIWSLALRRAGWADDRPVWTGSCPCQPFSAAGKRGGNADERHLWPHWFHLIQYGKPRDVPVFGEQVASKDGLAWLDLVHADLEGQDYTVGATDLCAAGVGAPHMRQRLYFVADSSSGACERDAGAIFGAQARIRGTRTQHGNLPDGHCDGGSTGELANADGKQELPAAARRLHSKFSERGHTGDAIDRGPQGRERPDDLELHRGSGTDGSTPTAGFWRDAEWLPCIDGKARPVEPGTFPLAHGVAARVGRLRAYGNAIVEPLAEEFIRAYDAVAG